MLPITLHQLTLSLSLIAKYCKKLVNLNLASFEEKLTPKKLNHRHKLFLDFISFKRYFPKWFQEILDNLFISLVTYNSPITLCKTYEREWSISDLILSWRIVRWKVRARKFFIFWWCQVYTTIALHSCRRGTYNSKKFCNIFWSQNVH